MTSTTYTYSDGSGNTYKINSDSIEYIPVKKENSSSGMYSGGEPATNKISRHEFLQVRMAFEAILENKSIHIENRMKGTGMIAIENEKVQTVFFKQSEEKENLEKLLKNLLYH